MVFSFLKEHVRLARCFLQMKQSELANITGISKENIQRIEKGFGEIKSFEATKNILKKSYEERGIVFKLTDKGFPYIEYDPDKDVIGYLKEEK